MTGHYETIELVDYARGYLTGEDARDVFAHCQGCTNCGDGYPPDDDPEVPGA